MEEHRNIKRNILFVMGLILAASLLFMIVTSTVDHSVYSLTVHEAVSRSADFQGQEIKIKGNVVPGSIQCQTAQKCRFKLSKGGSTIDVFYAGARPDTFKDCAEVIATGQLKDRRTFEAVDLIAKCPSKYDDLPGGCEQPEEYKQNAQNLN